MAVVVERIKEAIVRFRTALSSLGFVNRYNGALVQCQSLDSFTTASRRFISTKIVLSNCSAALNLTSNSRASFPVSLVSVSNDSKKLPKPYVYEDILTELLNKITWTPSHITYINDQVDTKIMMEKYFLASERISHLWDF
ncbi:hypothetical protein GGP41_010606 [Bipolaris sorokiniana]|uniref:CPAF-like PDZ domain-containing protein n=1 Tax=Cochliobolus sativus TaxID=45130 RepID=A0A8H5ZKX8_COCSA|nr:hypothetical protein GGP41_010606 [Bipolaris sorokiniana]